MRLCVLLSCLGYLASSSATMVSTKSSCFCTSICPFRVSPATTFPVQNTGMSLPTSAPVVQPSPVTVVTPGIPSSPPATQPIFPVVNNSIPSQASPFSTHLTVGGAQQSSHADALGSVNAYPPNSSIQVGGTNSHSYASGPNTTGPSTGPPPVIAIKAPSNQPNEVYLVWDDEASMEERRMSLPKYKVHDETRQMTPINAATDRRVSESRLTGRMELYSLAPN